MGVSWRLKAAQRRRWAFLETGCESVFRARSGETGKGCTDGPATTSPSGCDRYRQTAHDYSRLVDPQPFARKNPPASRRGEWGPRHRDQRTQVMLRCGRHGLPDDTSTKRWAVLLPHAGRHNEAPGSFARRRPSNGTSRSSPVARCRSPRRAVEPEYCDARRYPAWVPRACPEEVCLRVWLHQRHRRDRRREY